MTFPAQCQRSAIIAPALCLFDRERVRNARSAEVGGFCVPEDEDAAGPGVTDPASAIAL